MNARKKIEQFRQNPRIKMFLVFVLLSFIYWFFSALSEPYFYDTSYKLTFKDLPDSLFFQKEPPREIKVQVNASGFEILWHKFFPKNVTFSVSDFHKQGKYRYYIVTDKLLNKIDAQDRSVRMMRFQKDSLLLYLGNLIRKKIPVKPELQLQFTPGYKLTEALAVEPDSVLVKCPEIFIDTILQISTIHKSITGIQKDFSVKIPLQISHNNKYKIQYLPEEVRIHGSVSKFTQATKEVPIVYPDIGKSLKLELFPKKALITYEVAFEHFKQIDAGSFVLTCQNPMEKKDSSDVLDLYLLKKPDFIKRYSINPTSVNFLIKKK